MKNFGSYNVFEIMSDFKIFV